MREFKSAAKRESGFPNPVVVPLDIDGREMKATPPPSGVLALFLSDQADPNRAVQLRAVFDLLTEILPREDYDWLREQLRTNKTSLQTVTDVIEYLLEVWGGRPTKSSSASSTRQPSTGRRSMVKPRSKASTP